MPGTPRTGWSSTSPAPRPPPPPPRRRAAPDLCEGYRGPPRRPDGPADALRVPVPGGGGGGRTAPGPRRPLRGGPPRAGRVRGDGGARPARPAVLPMPSGDVLRVGAG